MLGAYTPLANLPTPVEEQAEFSRRNGVALHLKRDDALGGLQGGTKLRALEHIIWHALEARATDLITIGEPTSTQCRLVAALGRRFGLDVHLLLRESDEAGEGAAVNLRMLELLGARMTVLEEPEWRFYPLAVRRLSAELQRRERRPCFVPYGCAGRPGTYGILRLVLEIYRQHEGRFPFTHVVVPAGSGGTLFGFDLAFQVLSELSESPVPRIIGVSLDAAAEKIIDRLDRYFDQWNRGADAECRRSGRVEVDDRYSALSAEEREAGVRHAVEEIGELLDPLYVLPAFLGLSGALGDGAIAPGSEVLLLVTGPCVHLASELTTGSPRP